MPLSTNVASHEALVRFSRRLSHDLNNFSTIVSTYSELLLADLDPALPAHADIREINTASEGMVRYLARVTRFARAGAMKRVRVAVEAGVTEAVQAFRAAHGERVVEQSGSSAATIMADPVWWRDVMAELLENAHEAAPVGTPIRVAIGRTDGGAVSVTVRDQGSGFDPAIEPTACDPLVTTKEGIRGAGIGLTLVAAFLEACGGQLRVSREGDVTAVTVELPAA
jgi:signal transduction histidine kinase